MSTVYKVLITPRSGQFTYGTEIDVSDHIDQSGVGNIVQTVDATDFDIGLFYFGDITLKGLNKQGYFNDPSDMRSIFSPYSRDLAKVKVTFSNEDGDTITFNGLINEAGTTVDVENEEITFNILTRDSVIRDDNISGGTIANAVPVKTAFASILDVPRITSVLTFDIANINPNYNFTIDDGSVFDGMGKKDAITQLLAASNSVMVIDPSGNIIIKDRSDNNNASILTLFGKYDVFGRENIINIQNYNNGMQRMFTDVIVQNSSNNTQTEKSDPGLIATFGTRQKVFDFTFITDLGTQATVANNIMETFRAPKIEMVVTVKTALVVNAQLFDLVSVNYPLRIMPHNHLFLPIVGQAVIGDAQTPLPDTLGSTIIDQNTAFKIIEITHDERNFVSKLKLRQTGVTLSDGRLNPPKASRVGFAVIGDGVVGAVGDGNDTWNPCTIGGARVGNTRVA